MCHLPNSLSLVCFVEEISLQIKVLVREPLEHFFSYFSVFAGLKGTHMYVPCILFYHTRFYFVIANMHC